MQDSEQDLGEKRIIARRPNGTYIPGVSGNLKGKPVGISPLCMARKIILEVFQKNEALFRKRLSEECERDPLEYYERFVSIFFPKELLIGGNLDIHEKLSVQEVKERLQEIREKLGYTN